MNNKNAFVLDNNENNSIFTEPVNLEDDVTTLFMPLALCRCKASKPTDISEYFKGLATKQMCKDNGKCISIFK
ncbi:MAG: hypothetical protein KGY74_11135 [Candidatus Cloacimonetes bacterium]|nr:hypothetical protein [Candidatus Cloacimonadota bacterium]